MAFQIDDDKLRNALPAPTSTYSEDASVLWRIFGAVGLLIASACLLGYSLLRALF